MKKQLLSAASIIFVGGVFAQINVSTETTKRVAVLEEYTGNYCTFCPEGHKIADQIEATHGDQVITLKIQVGGFSGTDPIFGGTLQTPSGNAIAAPFDSNGYPNGIVNRAATGSVGRGQWAAQVNNIVSQDSPVNMYMESSIDVTTRELEVSVEYYYTADQGSANNFLHIGYYQDNIPAFQYDPGFYPENFYILSEEIYQFDHAFRSMINGNFGEVITPTTSGSTAVITKTITLPEAFSTFEVEPGSIKVFAFISSAQQGPIITGVKSTPEYSNFPTANDVAVLYSVLPSDEQCVGEEGAVSPLLLIGNKGGENLTSFQGEYSVGESSKEYDWTGNLSNGKKVAVSMDEITFTYALENELNIYLKNPNMESDDDVSNNTITSIIKGGPLKSATKLRFDAKTDQYASDESEFNVYNSNGDLLLASGLLPNSTITSFVLEVPEGLDCYRIQLLDDYGDSWNWNIDEAWVRVFDISDEEGEPVLIYEVDAMDFGAEYNAALKINTDKNIPVILSSIVSGGELCEGDNLNFTFESAESNDWDWDFGDGAIPAIASGIGPHDVTYISSGVKIITLSKGEESTSYTVTVNELPVIELGAVTDPTDCNTADGSIEITGTGSGFLAWTIDGVEGGASVTLPTILEDLEGANYTFTFINDDCSSEVISAYIIAPNGITPVITTIFPDVICVDDLTIDLAGGPSAGGEFSGAGVVNNQFDPAAAGVGTHVITYTVTEGDCSGSTSVEVEVDVCLSIKENVVTGFNLYPNPAQSKVTIDFGELSLNQATVSIINSIGQVVKVLDLEEAVDNKLIVDINDLNKGVYLVRVSSSDIMAISRLVVTK